MFRVDSIEELRRVVSPSIVEKNPLVFGTGENVQNIVIDKTKSKGNKYHVAPKEDRIYKGILFASLKEASKAAELDLSVLTGEIKGYLMQVPFHLPGGAKHRVDFGVLNLDDTVTWLEVKGRDLPMGKLKRHQVEELYHIRIEVY